MEIDEQIADLTRGTVADGLYEALIVKGWKTDIDSQIEAIEIISQRLIRTQAMACVVQSLKELRAIKRKNE